jgi:hypothetical protein
VEITHALLVLDFYFGSRIAFVLWILLAFPQIPVEEEEKKLGSVECSFMNYLNLNINDKISILY